MFSQVYFGVKLECLSGVHLDSDRSETCSGGEAKHWCNEHAGNGSRIQDVEECVMRTRVDDVERLCGGHIHGYLAKVGTTRDKLQLSGAKLCLTGERDGTSTGNLKREK